MLLQLSHRFAVSKPCILHQRSSGRWESWVIKPALLAESNSLLKTFHQIPGAYCVGTSPSTRLSFPSINPLIFFCNQTSASREQESGHQRICLVNNKLLSKGVQQRKSRDASLAHVNYLLGSLSQSHERYRLARYRRKSNLGRIHPMTMKMRVVSESSCPPQLPRTAGTRNRRFRVKLSSVLAAYIDLIARKRPSEYSQCTKVITYSPKPLGYLASPTQHSEENTSSQSKLMLQQLVLLKELATRQSEMVSKESLAYLKVRGYGLQDVAAWYWVLTGKTAEDSAMRFEFLMKLPISIVDDFGAVPSFVLLKLLTRSDISYRALTLLLRQSWQMLGLSDQHETDHDFGNTAHLTNSQPSSKSFGLDAIFVLVVRLLRHARRVWPAATVSIAQLWITYARVGEVIRPLEHDKMTERDATRLSFAYNRVLSLLGLPPNGSPYQSLHYRQRAQFMVIRQMKAFNPPLSIDREGYRGVTRVQLAHRKTHQERKWARLKAVSWPPWKEDRLGVDASVGIESGISRASNTLRQMVEAGYAPLHWEQSASILAGWDTDGSPTIQKRSVDVPQSTPLQVHEAPKVKMTKEKLTSEIDADAIWAARIKATRSLHEAWTCFLACEDSKTPLTSPIYHAMFEKVTYESKRKQSESNSEDISRSITEDQRPSPGDAREVVESSSSHNQVLSTREPLPTFVSLFDRMNANFIRPSGRLLETLLHHTRSLEKGVRVLRASDLDEATKKSLLPWKEPPVPDIDGVLQSLPDYLFAAYIGFLCRFAYVRRNDTFPTNEALKTVPDEIFAALLLLRHAFKLVIRRNPFYRPAWTSLLRLLAQPDTVVITKKVSVHPHAQGLPKYEKACRLLEYMDSIGLDLDFVGFQHFCTTFEHAAAAAKHTLATSSDYEERNKAQIFLNQGLLSVKSRFQRLIQPVQDVNYCEQASSDIAHRRALAISDDQNPQHPRLFCVPHPAQLHVYIRLLGQHPDYDGVFDLACWMSTFSEDIMQEAVESSNGARAMRTCLIAIRVFLEEPLIEFSECVVHLEGVKHAIARRDKAWKIIESNEDWDGWPTDEEVEQYVSVGVERGTQGRNIKQAG